MIEMSKICIENKGFSFLIHSRYDFSFLKMLGFGNNLLIRFQNEAAIAYRISFSAKDVKISSQIGI